MDKMFDMLVFRKWKNHESWYKCFEIYWINSWSDEEIFITTYDLLIFDWWRIQMDTHDFKEFYLYPRDKHIFNKIACNSMWNIFTFKI